MPALSDPDRLRSIKRLDQLVAYLRDELDWPIESDDIEDISFSYEPDELGLDAAHAAKIHQIKQIRPLASGQPWGIFWVSFEKKRLPVVVLRRILASLVVKSRRSANNSDRPRWQMHDLLFISAYGDETTDQREIAFAHFSQADGDLPTLRVLGWDGADTALKLDHVAHTLVDKLRWPANSADSAAWRQQWASAFRHRLGHVIRTSDMLAERLAGLARNIRDAAHRLLEAESERGPLTRLYKAFQAALIHDLTPETFADTYAQTITYGLFTAAVNRTPPDAEVGLDRTSQTALTADDISLMARVTSPFLKEMLETFLHVGGRKNGVDFDELGIQDVVELLRGDETDLPAILRDFGNRTRGEDPVIHFYEHFLSAYNKKLKVQRGVFYTPQPVVSYIVRSVHELLQTEFGLEDGLASTVTWGEMIQRSGGTSFTSPKSITSPKSKASDGKDGDSQSSSLRGLKLPPLSDEPGETRTISPDEPFVQILDPATGTATFLVMVIDIIFKHLKAKWEKGGLAAMPAILNPPPSILNFVDYWNAYVPQHLLPRLHGYELLAAPYAIAHLKLGLKLTETGYLFGSDERARIYLTNALEPKVRQLPQIGFEPLAHEAKAVNEIKWYKRFTVVIGNPPYSNFGQLNKIPFILHLLEDYKRGLDEKKINLDDDFIKFVRYSQYLLQQTGRGVFGFITNNVYADGVTHRRMRQSLLETFQELLLLDLHGSSKRKEQSPDGSVDENVFDIMVGVSVLLMARTSTPAKVERSILHSELWGTRASKYDVMATGRARKTKWSLLTPAQPYCFFVPKDFGASDEYQKCVPIQEVFPIFSSGIQTKRDNVAIAETKDSLLSTVKDFARLSPEELRRRYDLPEDGRDWKIEWASAHAKAILKSPDVISPILYRPFDSRWTVMDDRSKGFVAYPRFDVMSQMVRTNFGLIVTRQLSLPTFQHVLATRELIDGNSISLQTREYNYLFPLYIQGEQSQQGALNFGSQNRANLGDVFLKKLAESMKCSLTDNGLPDGVTPEDIFHYAYGVFHSPGYRSRYAEFLKIDFPRLPLTGNLELFRALGRIGGELVALHLLEFEVGTSRCDVPARASAGGTKGQHAHESPDCAAERGADGAARRPYPQLTEFIGSNHEVSKVGWIPDKGGTVWIDASGSKTASRAGTSGFRGVPENVWNFHIGGYQVCEKWLKDRKGRILTADDRAHYQKVIVALSETIRLMKEIDAVIEKHGGWPLK